MKQAKRRVALESEVECNPRYKTLFYGLKKNQPHNMAIVHPLSYLLRRVLFVMVTLFVFETPLFAALSLVGVSLLMMGVLLTERQWEASLINVQHLVNEIVLYLVLVLLVLFTSTTIPTGAAANLGWLLIALVVAMIFFNTAVMIYYSLRWFKMWTARMKRIKEIE